MDIVTLSGLVLGLVGVFVGMVVKGVPFSAILNPAAALIIFVGTAGAVFIATPASRIKNVVKLFGVIFGEKKRIANHEIIEFLVHFSEIARREGLLALEKEVKEIDDSFMKRGFMMVIDGANSDFLEEALADDIASMEERHAANAQIFAQAGMYAPTLGVLGAVIGLIAALGNINDTEALGHAISVAFMATMFGIFTGYVICHPFSNKLRQKSKIEVETKKLILKGILTIQLGENPRILREKLYSCLSEGERSKLSGKNVGPETADGGK